MITIFLIGFVIFITYLTFISLKYGVLDSISESYYHLPKKWNILFTIFSWGYAFPTMMTSLSLHNTPFMFICAALICFVGAAAAYKDNFLTTDVHMVSAKVAVIFGYLSLIIDYKAYIISLMSILLASLFVIFKIKHKIWWAEFIIIFTVILVVGLSLFGIKII